MLNSILNPELSFWIGASAGCGKTTLLICRLVCLLVQQRKNIVCITFTNAAAKEIKNRLFDQLAKFSVMQKKQIADHLKKNFNYKKDFDFLYVKNLLYTADSFVRITTFHSFCARLLQDIDLFYSGIELQEETDENLLSFLIDQFLCTELNLPKKVSELITEAKLNDIFLHLMQNSYENQNLDTNEKTSNFKDVVPHSTIEILKCFIQVKAKYKSIKKNHHTYNAIINNCIEKKPWNLFEIASGIDHILVDEAQDTNLKQWYIIAKLCEDFFLQDGKTIFVVGDKKQSIYGFQGADPDIFQSFYHILKAQDLQNTLIKIQIQKSYRSAKPLLEFVDSAFNELKARQSFAETVYHDIHRINCSGYVQIEPLIALDQDGKDKNFLLAELIAIKIKNWILQKRLLRAKNTIVKPSDIAVLVAHRTTFVANLHQKLQEFGIPVNIVGKIEIEQNPILLLLLNIGRFVLCKKDELALAEILQSPIFDLSYQEIAKIKLRDKNKSLLENLKPTSIWQKLEAWSSFDGKPFKIFTNIMNKEIYHKLYNFYGQEFDYYLDVFLTNTTKKESIYAFLTPLLKSGATLDIKSANKNGVTISTVHGSKGMQYPIVFVADANYVPQYRDILLYNKDGMPLWHEGEKLECLEKIKEDKKKQIYQEYLRLLYVALTRAEDEIYIFGVGSRAKKGSWYEICMNSLQKIGKEKGEAFYYTDDANYIAYDKQDSEKRTDNQNCKKIDLELPEEIRSHHATSETKKGELIHKALEYIFYIQNKEKWLKDFLQNFGQEFSQQERQEIFDRIITYITNNKESNGLNEVEITSNGMLFRIDNIKISNDSVLITDYKTNKDKALTDAMQKQLETYKALVTKIYPDKNIKAQVAWV